MVLKRIVVGVFLFALASLFILAPGLGPSIPLAAEFVFVIGLGIVGASLLYLRSGVGPSGASPPAPEKPVSLPSPGENIEDQLRTLSRNPLRPDAKKNWKETRAELQSRLRVLTVRTLTERFNLSETEANRLLDSGSWTDNPHAVAFFTGEYPDWTPSRVRLRQERLAGRAAIGTQAEHVIDELGAIERGERMLSEDALAETSGEFVGRPQNADDQSNGGQLNRGESA